MYTTIKSSRSSPPKVEMAPLSNTSAYFLHIYAKPKSRQDTIEQWIVEGEKYLLQLRIMAPPERGKANKALSHY